MPQKLSPVTSPAKKLLLAMSPAIQKSIASVIASNKLLAIDVHFCFGPCTCMKFYKKNLNRIDNNLRGVEQRASRGGGEER